MMGGRRLGGIALLAAAVLLFGFGGRGYAQCDKTIDGHGSNAYEPSHLIKPAPGILCNLTVNFHTAATRTVLLIDNSSIPSDGALPSCDNGNPPCVRWCFEGLSQSTDAAETPKAVSWGLAGLKFTSGIVVAASTSTNGCTTLTSDGSNDWFNWQAP